MRNRFDSDFGDMARLQRQAVKGYGGFAILAVALNLVFWLGLIGGTLMLAKHFGVF